VHRYPHTCPRAHSRRSQSANVSFRGGGSRSAGAHEELFLGVALYPSNARLSPAHVTPFWMSRMLPACPQPGGEGTRTLCCPPARVPRAARGKALPRGGCSQRCSIARPQPLMLLLFAPSFP